MSSSHRVGTYGVLFAVAALGLTSCVIAQEPWTVGTVGGASFRLRVPDPWNGMLIVAAGGYAPAPITFKADENVSRFVEGLTTQGYAYAETGYSAGGVAIAEAVDDVRALRKEFERQRGAPKRTFVVGESKGGLVALLLMESGDTEFDGALTISGLFASPLSFFQRAFEVLSAFYRYFPSTLPNPERIPVTYRVDEQIVRNVLAHLERDSATAAELRRVASVRTNHELAELVAFHTEALGDLQRRCGGNGFGPAADRAARECLNGLPSPAGRLQRPLLAVDTRHDPIIPRLFAEQYLERVARSGRPELVVRRVVDGDGHLAVRTGDRLSAFAALVRWVVDGVPPSVNNEQPWKGWKR